MSARRPAQALVTASSWWPSLWPSLARDPSLTAIEQALRHRFEDSPEPIGQNGVTAVLNAAISDAPSR
jgi:hypothetical protein